MTKNGQKNIISFHKKNIEIDIYIYIDNNYTFIYTIQFVLERKNRNLQKSVFWINNKYNKYTIEFYYYNDNIYAMKQFHHM